VLWELSKDILEKDTSPRKKHGKMTPQGTRSVYKGKYLWQRWTPVLMGASGKIHPLFKRMFRHPCHYAPRFSEQANLKNLWAQLIR
jgi:hypothetical protein